MVYTNTMGSFRVCFLYYFFYTFMFVRNYGYSFSTAKSLSNFSEESFLRFIIFRVNNRESKKKDLTTSILYCCWKQCATTCSYQKYVIHYYNWYAIFLSFYWCIKCHENIEEWVVFFCIEVNKWSWICCFQHILET